MLTGTALSIRKWLSTIVYIQLQHASRTVTSANMDPNSATSLHVHVKYYRNSFNTLGNKLVLFHSRICIINIAQKLLFGSGQW